MCALEGGHERERYSGDIKGSNVVIAYSYLPCCNLDSLHVML